MNQLPSSERQSYQFYFTRVRSKFNYRWTQVISVSILVLSLNRAYLSRKVTHNNFIISELTQPFKQIKQRHFCSIGEHPGIKIL